MIAIAMVASNRSRYLAPLALAAVVGATVIVVTSDRGSSHHVGGQPTSAVTSTTTSTRHGRRHHARSYVVQSGDTLSAIAVKTGVPLSTLETLNPGANPSALQTGQRLKLGQ